MKIKTYVDTRKPTNQGLFPVLISVNRDGFRFFVNTGIYTATKFEGREFPKSDPNHKVKTNALNRLLLQVEEYAISHLSENNNAFRHGMRLFLVGKATERKGKRLYGYVEDYAETITKQSTKRIYKVTIAKIKEFDKDATLDITPQWLTDFEEYFTQKKGMSVNGIGIHLRNIRTVINQHREELSVPYPFKSYIIKEVRVPIRNLSIEQLKALRDYPCEEWQTEYRDLFMLSFYLCGVNAGDLLLCKSLTNGRFVFTRRKTNKKGKRVQTYIDIPICPQAQAIIDKYKGKNYLLNPLDRYKSYNDYLHHWNDGLRKIGEVRYEKDKVGRMRKKVYEPLFGDFRLTTNVARDTFASISASLGIPREHTAMCLGHSWCDVTDYYIHYEREVIDSVVRKVVNALQ